MLQIIVTILIGFVGYLVVRALPTVNEYATIQRTVDKVAAESPSTVAEARLQNVVMLGGDVHMNVAAQLRVQPNDERSPVVASEIVTTSITSRGLGEKLLAQIRDSNPDIVHARSDERGYTLLEVRPEGISAEFRTTANPALADGVFKAQAKLGIRSGVAGVHKDG